MSITLLYTAHLWCSHSKAKMNKIKVTFNDALRILLTLMLWGLPVMECD